jgi:hypothetical protein
MEITTEKEIKKRGRKPKNQRQAYTINNEQTKFFIDVSKEKSSQELIFELLRNANNKEHGREITFKDIVISALGKLTAKDIEKIQEDSLTEMQKVEKTLLEYNKKNNTKLSLGEFLVKKLNIN